MKVQISTPPKVEIQKSLFISFISSSFLFNSLQSEIRHSNLFRVVITIQMYSNYIFFNFCTFTNLNLVFCSVFQHVQLMENICVLLKRIVRLLKQCQYFCGKEETVFLRFSPMYSRTKQLKIP